MEEIYRDVDGFNQTLQSKGGSVRCRLEPPDTGTVVRAQDGEVLTTEGPFAEAKEHLGGFWIIDAPDLDAAPAWAAQATVACRAPVQVRPFEEHPRMTPRLSAGV